MKNIDEWYRRLATKLVERDDWFNMNQFLIVYYDMRNKSNKQQGVSQNERYNKKSN